MFWVHSHKQRNNFKKIDLCRISYSLPAGRHKPSAHGGCDAKDKK